MPALVETNKFDLWIISIRQGGPALLPSGTRTKKACLASDNGAQVQPSPLFNPPIFHFYLIFPFVANNWNRFFTWSSRSWKAGPELRRHVLHLIGMAYQAGKRDQIQSPPFFSKHSHFPVSFFTCSSRSWQIIGFFYLLFLFVANNWKKKENLFIISIQHVRPALLTNGPELRRHDLHLTGMARQANKRGLGSAPSRFFWTLLFSSFYTCSCERIK